MISQRTMNRLNQLEKAVGIKSLEFHKYSDPKRIEKLEMLVDNLSNKVIGLEEELDSLIQKRKPGRPRKVA